MTPKPYSGKEKYIFISYSHKDTAQVFPIISELVSRGYRVWFDQGIDPGTEWDENIANHIQECGYFLAFISGNYLNSNNCKDELNYARDLEKERLIVYLEKVTLPSGLAMRLNRIQAIHKYTYNGDVDFYGKLFTANGIDVCREEIRETIADDPITEEKSKPEEPRRTYAESYVKTPSPQRTEPTSDNGAKNKLSSVILFWIGVSLLLSSMSLPNDYNCFSLVTASLIFLIVCFGGLGKKWMRGITIAAFCVSLIGFIAEGSAFLHGSVLFIGSVIAILTFIKSKWLFSWIKK